MQVTVETVSKLERKMRITVPASEVSEKVEVKIKQAAGQVRIKGFRPGKVPIREVRRRFGPGILQEVSSEIMQQSFAAAVDQQSLKPAGMPEINDVVMELDKDLSFSALIEIFPEIKLGAFEDISDMSTPEIYQKSSEINVLENEPGHAGRFAETSKVIRNIIWHDETS